MATEDPVIFPEGIGVVPWMVPGGSEIAKATSELMKKYNIVVWTHHGMFCSGKDFDEAFGLMDTAEKAAEICVKVRSMGGKKQTITTQNFLDLARDFKIELDIKQVEVALKKIEREISRLDREIDKAFGAKKEQLLNNKIEEIKNQQNKNFTIGYILYYLHIWNHW